MELDRVRFNFLIVNAAAERVTKVIAANTMSVAAVLNSGIFGVAVGLGEVEVVGVEEADVEEEESGIT